MLKIYNTLDRQLEDFVPIEALKVKFYQCGPTVYSTQHIGNMRAMLMGDLIRRSFTYLGYDVQYARNYTDFGHLTSDADEGEDKMTKGAAREGKTPDEIAQKYIDQFDQDVNALNLLWPDYPIRATSYIDAMINMVEILLDKGFAYVRPEAIYFDVSKFPEYTKMSGKKLEAENAGAGHGDVAGSGKKNAADFAVWFFRTGPHANALQYWESPFTSPAVEKGYGFPGWHIECSAMVKAVLGDTIDVHMGGVEHISIHHPNEIAQSESANGVKYVNYWLHNEHLTVNGGKMAKSDGTGYSLAEIMEKGYDPLDLRYFFLQAHYRSKQNFTWEALDAAKIARKRLNAKAQELFKLTNVDTDPLDAAIDPQFQSDFKTALEDDFNIPQALAIAWEMLKVDAPAEVKFKVLLDFDKVLGLKLETIATDPREETIPTAAQALIDARAAARAQKDWSKADELRDQLKTEFGIEVKDK